MFITCYSIMNSISHCNIKLEMFMRLARKIWGRDISTERSRAVEGRRFRQFFGCPAAVVLSVSRRLAMNHRFHMVENVMCIIIKIKDPKTFRGRVKYFISAIVDLEADIVINPFFFGSYLCTST